jgi:hypothetical protein
VHQPAIRLYHAILQTRSDAQLHALNVQNQLGEVCRAEIARETAEKSIRDRISLVQT